MPLISIISAIHNGLALNKVFWKSLAENTVNPFELIIIDNVSTDGSTDFFKEKGAVVIYNTENYAYSHCQNQGIAVAKGDYLCFLNNDLFLSPKWDERLITIATQHGLDAFSGCGPENTGDYLTTRKLDKRWKRIKYPMLAFGQSIFSLNAMIKLMYGNWVAFCESRYAQYGNTVVEGILGNNVVLTKRAVELLGGWDPRVKASDFDIFMMIKKRSIEKGDIKPCHIALGVYIHHYGRMTSKYARKRYKPFTNEHELIKLKDKWTAEEMRAMHPDNATLIATKPASKK